MGISLDFSKLPLDDAFLSSMQGRIDKAFADMKALESGAVANPDEGRMVGHYWLRNSAPVSYTHLDVYKRQDFESGVNKKR